MVYQPPRDRILETSTTSGSGPWSLGGAFDASYNAFSSFMSNGDTTLGFVVEAGQAFAVGTLTYTSSGNTIALSGIIASKGSFSTGTKQIFPGLPAILGDVGGARTAVADAAYAVLATDRVVAYTSISAARAVSLPAASAYPAGVVLIIADESGSCSATNTITVSRAGSDTVDGGTSSVIKTAYGFLAIESNGTSKWTIVGASSIVGGTIDNVVIGATTPAAASVTAPSAGDSSARAVTSAWFGQNLPGGLVNLFRNAAMSVWQRGTSALAGAATTVNAYWADGWIMNATYSSGSGPVGSQVANNRTGARTQWALKILGAANITHTVLKQRIEGAIAAALGTQTVTVSAWVFNNSGSSLTPTLTVKYPTATDNYASTTTDSNISATNLQACGNSAWTQVSYTFTPTGTVALGMEVAIDFLALVATEFVYVTELDIRATPGVATGLNSNPPPAELRPIATELAFCQRYFWKSFPQATAPATGTGTGGAIFYIAQLSGANYNGVVVVFPTTMRASPTIVFYNPVSANTNWYNNTRSADSGPSVAAGTSDRGLTAINNPQNASDVVGQSEYVHATASAEL